MRTIIIAEIGECFNGSMEIARNLMEVACDAGCDIVKFQILDMDEVASDDPEYEWFSRIALHPDSIKTLIGWADELGIGILFTPVSIKTALWILESGMDTVKIASSFVSKRELLSFINQNFKTVYASTGMASLDEITQMMESMKSVKDIRIMHCVSEYPTGPLLEQRGLKALDEKDAHLAMMQMLQAMYPSLMIGYSDHTEGIFVPVTAVAMGAKIIEKHITLDRTTPIHHFKEKLSYMGTDHVLSIEPKELKEMVRQIRHVEDVRGEWIWKRSEGEKILMDFLKGRYKERG